MRGETEVRQTIDQYADMVRRICLVYMKNESDTEDVFQDVFLKYALSHQEFTEEEHKKAWLIRVSINRCKDLLKSFFRKNSCGLEAAQMVAAPQQEDQGEVLRAVLRLPEKERVSIFLYYYEGYSAVEIASLLHKNTNTVYTNLSRAKTKLKDWLGGEEDA